MDRVSDVVVIGGGAIGGSVAWALARRGVSVTVVEAGRIGRGASWAAAGVLAPDSKAHDPPALAELAWASLALWPDWVAELEDWTGVGLNFRRDGLLNLWVDPEAPHLPRDLATEPPPRGPGQQWLGAAEVRALEPGLTGPILTATRDCGSSSSPPTPPRWIIPGSPPRWPAPSACWGAASWPARRSSR